MYVDDTALIAPSPMLLQILIDCCVSLPQPEIYLQEQLMTFVDHEKYLGVVMSDNCTNDRDITRQMRALYARGNLSIRNFKHYYNYHGNDSK